MDEILNLIQRDWLTTSLIGSLFIAILALVLKPKQRYNLPPEPPGIPLLGHIPFLRRNFHVTLDDYKKKYGSVFCIRFGRRPCLILGDYDVIKETYKLEGFTDRAPELVDIKPGLTSLFEMNGREWLDHRKFAYAALRGASRERSTEDIIQDEIRTSAEKISEHLSKNMDIREFLSTIINNISYILIWGKSYHEDRVMTKKLLYLQRITGEQFSWKPICAALGIPGYLSNLIPAVRKANVAIAEMDDFIKSEIERHKATLNHDNPKDFIDMALTDFQKSDGSGKFQSYMSIRGDAQMLLLAASETVRSSMEWIFLHLAKHQDIQEKVYQEIKDVLGDNQPSWSDHERFPYTEAFIMETQRVCTMLPVNLTRQAPRDIKLRGYDILKGTWIMANFWAVHNDPKLWEKPEVFDPTRFISKDGERVIVPEYWIPFSFGHRNCVGDKIAKMELFLITIVFLQRYKVFPPSNGVSLEGDFYTTYSAIHPYIRLENRKS